MSVTTRSTTRTTSRALAALALAATAAGAGLTAVQSAEAAPSTGVRTAAQVPWSSVGKGWVVAQVKKNGHDNLVLVSPNGQSYQLRTIDGQSLASVSPDGKRVILASSTGVHTVDLRTGKTLGDLHGLEGATFTRPTGTNVVGVDGSNRLKNYTSTGKLTTSGARLPYAPWAIVPSPSGTQDVVATAKTVQLFNHATLRPIRTFAAPKGYTSCQPITFIDANHVRLACVSTKAPQNAWATSTTVFTQDIRGGAPKAVTSGTYPGGTSQGTSLGFSGAWDTSKGTIAAPNLATFTGSTRLFRVAGGKVVQTYSVPMAKDAARMTPMVQTMQGTSAYFASNLHEPGPSIALRYDVATGSVTYLAGAHSQYGGTVANYSVVQ